jgi:hypothetical protein
MLTIEALQSSLPLAERLDQRGFVALPRQDSPLEILCARTRSAEEVVSATDGVTIKVDVQQMALSAATKDPVFGDCAHDTAIDDIAAVCIPAVQAHIKHAKTVVAPAVGELVQRTTEILSHQTAEKLLGMEVTVEDLPAPLTNGSFDSMVRKYEETPLNSPPLSFDLPDQTGQEIVDLMKTGSGSLDSEVEQFASTLGDGCLMGIWRDLFQQKQNDLVETTGMRFIDYLHDSECGLDNALVIFLLARKLVDNPLDGITMSLQTYETLMADFRDQAAAHLCRELDAIDQAERSGALVVKYTNNNVVVNAQLYRKWIDEGGENEVLFGNLLQANPYVMLADIEENAQQLKRAWANHSALVATVEQNKRFARTKEALASVFRQQMRDMDDAERANIDVEKAITRFDVLLDDVVESDMECLFTLALRLVCRSRFIKSEAERILSGIERVKKKNPQLDVREAAAISTIEYVAWWVSTQVYFVDAKTMKATEAQQAPVVLAV